MAGVPSNIQLVSSASESEYESVDFNGVACNKSNSNGGDSLLDLVDSELARRFSSTNPLSSSGGDTENNYEAINNKPSIIDDCSLIKRNVDSNSNESFLNSERAHSDLSVYSNGKSNGLSTQSQKSIESEQNEINKLVSSPPIDSVYDFVRTENGVGGGGARINGDNETNGHSHSNTNSHTRAFDENERDNNSEDESAHIYENISFSDENEKPEDEQCERRQSSTSTPAGILNGGGPQSLEESLEGISVDSFEAEPRVVKERAKSKSPEPEIESEVCENGASRSESESPEPEEIENSREGSEESGIPSPAVSHITRTNSAKEVPTPADPSIAEAVNDSPQFPTRASLPSFTVSELTFETWTTADDVSAAAAAALAAEAAEAAEVAEVAAIATATGTGSDDTAAVPDSESEVPESVGASDVTDKSSVLHDDVFEDVSSSQTKLDSDVEQTEEISETTSEKKGKKKKNSLTESTCTTKTKKTKKTKKSEEKENISVITNGHDFEKSYFNNVNNNSNVLSSSTLPVDDDLSNICVRDLKQVYCSEVNKSSSIKHEEPVPPSIPIKELKSSFSKFDQLTKKTVLHVRSSDATEAQNLVQARQNGEDNSKECKQCGKAVFVVEQVKAEGHVWHKNCFRCKTCNKLLTVDTYSSHEGELYCKPHFRELFKPKAVIEDEEPASDKPDLGLEELSSLDVKSRFQVFEKSVVESNDIEKSPSTISVKRSPSILSKLAKFQAKGMDVGVPDESLNGIPYDESESSSDENDESGTVRNSVASERPMKFSDMVNVKKSWEDAGRAQLLEERREERKQERQHLRSHLLMGKQGKMKELYEQAVAESEQNARSGRGDSDLEVLKIEKARVLKERFERGEVNHEDEDDEEDAKKQLKEDDLNVFEAGICKKSRSLFLEMDANTAKTQSSPSPLSSPQCNESKKVVKPVNVNRQVSDDIVKSSDKVEDVVVETSDISSKFKFFETYKAPEVKRRTFRITPPRDDQGKADSPDRQVDRDPNVVRADDPVNEAESASIMKSQTTSKMLSIFRQMEEAKDTVPDGPKPLKRFTPPPDYKENNSESEEETESEEEEEEEESEEEIANGDIVRSSDQVQDEFLQQSQKAAVRARALKEKFERWEPEKQSNNNAINLLESDQASIEPTKNLRARFESLKSEQPIEKPRPRVNRFIPEAPQTLCNLCQKKVYQLEKIETDGKIFHKYCFRCTQCHCVLRIESYTFNNGYLYCLPHFKQLFISKGNYDEGFGADPLQKKWAHNHNLSNNGSPPIPVVNGSH